ncbi:hypothetical protein OH77DRAFT_1476410 [Trametes cingulata]|nr:hypothetical protein OH77DRAFT_1476410 [Trametes cingulata]
MWVITGPFDDEYADDGSVPPPDKSKLLKTGSRYTVGRKDQPLTIKSKAISKAHAVFIVGHCTEEQAADPTFIPTLTIQDLTNRTRHVERPTVSDPRFKCQPNSTLDLESEDIIHLSASVPVRVRWERICCYYGSTRAGPPIPTKDCAALGINIVPSLHPDVTHHLTPTYTLNPSIATSLLSLAAFVKPEWLSTLLQLGKAESGELSTLEESFALPATSKFRPTFSPALPPRLKKFDIWQPNEERIALFRDYRFIFAGAKGSEASSALKELVRRAEAEYECFAVQSGPERFRQVLAKGQARKATLVLVADRHAVVPAVGEDEYRALLEEAKSFGLKFVAPDKILEAVVYADRSYVDSSSAAEEVPEESILPDVIPNTLEDEPSIPPSTGAERRHERDPSPPVQEMQQEPPRRRLLRRTTSRASSRQPSPPPDPAQTIGDKAEEPHAQPVQPRRTLVRRAARPKTIVGIDDTTMDIDGNSISGRPSVESQGPSAQSGYAIPPTPSRPGRLKRRVGTQAQSITSELFPASSDALVTEAEEPPHKKFKALFDESDPDKVAHMNLVEYASQHVSGGESMTQYEPSMPPRRGMGEESARSGGPSAGAGVPLEALMEEEEESTLASTQTQGRGTKRKSQAVDAEGDVAMEDEAPPRTKRRTGAEASQMPPQAAPQSQIQSQSKPPLSKVVTRVDMSQSQVHVKEKPVSKKAAGSTQSAEAAAGEPDKDAAFLKAVASTKRGKKKTEDTFDREFNNLRISKPDLEREKESEGWAVLEEFGDDGDLRGNFMVVLEMPVFRESENGLGREHLRRGEGRLEWQGRPDFKKFKKKTSGHRREPVELVVEEENDLGIGSQYWKGTSQGPAPSQSYSQAKMESEPEKSTTQRSTQRSSRSRPTLVSDEEERNDETFAPSKPPSRLKSQAKATKSQESKPSTSQVSARKSSQKQPLFVGSDIDEDDERGLGMELDVVLGSDEDGDGLESTLRSSEARGRVASAGQKRNAPLVVDDDSDDGATFKALGARTRTRRR